MGLLAGGGALLSKNSESPESWHVGRFPWTLNLSRHCLWNHIHRKPKKLAACALYAFRELKELNLIWSCMFAPCKALCKTLQTRLFSSFPWMVLRSCDPMVQTTAALFTQKQQNSRGMWICSWEINVAGWGRVLDGNHCSKCDWWNRHCGFLL